MKLTVIDNVISKNYQNLIEDNFSTSKIAWYFAENITSQASDTSSSGFSHTIFKDNNPTLHNTPHLDHTFKHYTMIYYILDSDGPTRIFSEGKVINEIEPKKGRAVFFSGDTYHASAAPKNHSKRMVINYNFLI